MLTDTKISVRRIGGRLLHPLANAASRGGTGDVARWARRLVLAGGLALGAALGGPPAAALADGAGYLQVAFAGQLNIAPSARPGDHLLSQADVDRYRMIFAYQQAGRWPAADRLIGQLEDRRLLGHVLFQRYMHPTGWTSSYEELRDWLAQYADHPGADRIHRLAQSRRPLGAAAPRAPMAEPAAPRGLNVDHGVDGCDLPGYGAVAASVRREIARMLRQTQPSRALDYLNRENRRTPLRALDYDRLRGTVAAGYYYAGVYDQALGHAAASVDRSGAGVPEAQWIAGLSAWRLNDYDAAARYFEAMAAAECSTAWGVSGAAYWAARAHLRNRNPVEVSRWLQVAAEFPRTFYGLLASRALGSEPDLNFDPPALGQGHLALAATIPAGQRALALAQVGRGEGMEGELLRLLASGDDPRLWDIAIGLAQDAGAPALALALGSRHQPADGAYYDGALYPLLPLTVSDPDGVDQALVHAVVRRESRFEPDAVSYAGARGLMQLMPATASYVAGRNLRGEAGNRLFDPEFNLRLGQAYFARLRGYPGLDDDLIRLLIAYNAGAGTLERWARQVDADDDPLLFMESLPQREARAYVERVMADFWVYRLRLGQPVPSLDMIVAGSWPRYTSLDGGSLLEMVSYARD